METVRDFIFFGFKITADADCSHEIKRYMLLVRKVMINLDSILKSRGITLPTKVHLVKAICHCLGHVPTVKAGLMHFLFYLPPGPVVLSMAPRPSSPPVSECPGRRRMADTLHPKPDYGEGNGTPLQYSCLENPMDGGAW